MGGVEGERGLGGMGMGGGLVGEGCRKGEGRVEELERGRGEGGGGGGGGGEDKGR